ncbi:kinase-like protein [Gyrodon lividus]|nr:kinase-like protein [Gyrodon lividus]
MQVFSKGSSYQTTSQRRPAATWLDTCSLRILTSAAKAGPVLSSTSPLVDQHAEQLGSVPYENLTNRIRRKSRFPAAGGGYGDIYQCFLDMGTGSIEVAVKSLRQFTTPDGEDSCLPTTDRVQLVGTAVFVVAARWQMVIHGDLTGTNVLIGASGKAYLSDFGLATIHHEFLGTSLFTSSPRGNVRWVAPDLFQVPEVEGSRSVLCSEETDVYSYGSIMLQVLSGKVPFFGFKTQQIYYKVSLGHRPPRETGWNGQPIPEIYWRFIQRCWGNVPSKRLSSFQVLEFIHS